MANILIVDDEPSIRNIIGRALEEDGHQCTQASDAREARAALENQAFELALMDITMPGESGLNLVRYARETFPDLVIIMVTGVDEPGSIDSAIAAGVYSYMLKPFNIRQIRIQVRNTLAHQRANVANSRYQEGLEQMLAEKIKDIKASEEQFRTITSSTHDAIIMMDDKGKIAFWNESAERLFGYASAEVIGKDLHHLVAPERYWDAFGKVFPKFRKSGQGAAIGKTLELEALTRDGQEIPVELSLSSARINGAWHAFGIIRDIRERRSAQERLQQSEEQYRTLIEAVQEGVRVSKKGVQVFVNKRFVEIFGYETPEELMGKEDIMVVHPDDRERVTEINRRRSQGAAGPSRYEFKGMRKNGTAIDIAVTVTQATYFGEHADIAFLVDISERKKAEEELKRAHAKTNQLLGAVFSILIAMDREDRIVEWNAIAEKTFGMTREQALGRKLAECGIRRDEKVVNEALEYCRKTGEPRKLDDIRYDPGDGKNRFLGMTISPVLAEDETAWGTMIVAADITERRVLQSQLAQAQKLESIGQLAAGIAHEINTPTQYVGDNTRFLKDGFEDLERLLEDYEKLVQACREENCSEEVIRRVAETTDEIDLDYLRKEIPTAIVQSLEGVERVANIVRAMKEFSHPGSNEKTPTDINKAIENTVTVARNEWKYVADLATDFDETLPPVPCLPGEMNQVILNMIVNASHAIADVVDDGSEEKGNITIRTRKMKDWAEIAIEDTGAGIPEEIRSRIFDPFFTTKEVGRGTGQGLCISHDVIVEKHGGTIDVQSEVGKGTTFLIHLPLENQES